jgi:Domain of unknown function (DUF4062)
VKTHVTVFVCGTYSDLRDERGAVLDAIQGLQIKHRSMEFFGARPERPIETCLKEVRSSQILVLIIGRRYGTLVPGLQISYSEAEYDEAFRLGRKCLVYIRNDLPAAGAHPDDQEAILLAKWIAKLKGRHTVAFFSDTTKLAVRVAIDLPNAIDNLDAGAPNGSQVAAERFAASHLKVHYCQRFGDESRQLLHGLSVDADGNIIIAGDFWGSVDFGGQELASFGDRDVFIAKFDYKGNHIWSRRYGDDFEQDGTAVCTDAKGAVFLTSAFTGTIDFGGRPLASKAAGTGGYNMALVKLDPAGSHVWSHCFGDSGYHVPECMAIGLSGRVSIAGRFQGRIDFGSCKIQSRAKQTDIFLATFSSEGDCVWAKSFAGPYEQQTRSIATDSGGNIVLTGVFKGEIDFGGHTLREDRPEDYCGFLAKIDPHGAVIWCKRLGEPFAEQGGVVAFDQATGDIVLTGLIRNKLPTGSASPLCMFARYDASGVLRWSKTFENTFASSISISPCGQILLVGFFEATVDFGLGPLTSAGGYDFFAATFTGDGAASSSARFGDSRQQFLISGAYGRDDSIVLAGSFHGTVDFGNGFLVAAGYDGVTEGSEDLFLAILGG